MPNEKFITSEFVNWTKSDSLLGSLKATGIPLVPANSRLCLTPA